MRSRYELDIRPRENQEIVLYFFFVSAREETKVWYQSAVATKNMVVLFLVRDFDNKEHEICQEAFQFHLIDKSVRKTNTSV